VIALKVFHGFSLWQKIEECDQNPLRSFNIFHQI